MRSNFSKVIIWLPSRWSFTVRDVEEFSSAWPRRAWRLLVWSAELDLWYVFPRPFAFRLLAFVFPFPVSEQPLAFFCPFQIYVNQKIWSINYFFIRLIWEFFTPYLPVSLTEKNIGPNSANQWPSTAVTHCMYSFAVMTSSWYTT